MVIYVDFYYRLGRVNGVGLGQLKISNVYNTITGFCSPGTNATNLLYILKLFSRTPGFTCSVKISNVYNIITGFGSPGANPTNLL